MSADRPGRDCADGVLCSANVPRRGPQAALGSSLISLRRAHHRRGPEALRWIGPHHATFPGWRASGGFRSEIKEGGRQAGGTFAEKATRRPPSPHRPARHVCTPIALETDINPVMAGWPRLADGGDLRGGEKRGVGALRGRCPQPTAEPRPPTLPSLSACSSSSSPSAASGWRRRCRCWHASTCRRPSRTGAPASAAPGCRTAHSPCAHSFRAC